MATPFARCSSNLIWRLEYDDANRVTTQVSPSGGITKYGYQFYPNGRLRSVTQTSPEGATVRWGYNEDGRLASMTDGEGEVVYGFTSNRQLESVSRKGTPPVKFTYDISGRKTSMEVGDFYRIRWSYDFLGRMTNMMTPAGPISFEYQAGQNMAIRSLPNGIKTMWSRHPNGQLRTITHGLFKRPSSTEYTLLVRYSYRYSADNRIARIEEQGGRGDGQREFAYDRMGRVIRAVDHGGTKFSYEYDAVGNRTSAAVPGKPDQKCDYDWAGRLDRINGNACRYDDNGNLMGISLDGRERQYRHHFDGRLASARLAAQTAEYRNDGNGRLIARKSGTVETRFIADPQSPLWKPLVIEETNGQRTLIVWDGDHPLAFVRGNQIQWYLQDQLGSARLVADAQGEITGWRDYGPFGEALTGNSEGDLLPGFAGLLADSLAQGYLTRSRTFDPLLGTFLEPDPRKVVPCANPQSIPLYAYCAGDPVNFVDRGGSAADSFDAGQLWWSTFGASFINGMSSTLNSQYAKDYYASLASSEHNYLWDGIGAFIPGPGGDAAQAWMGIPIQAAETFLAPPLAIASGLVGVAGDIRYAKPEDRGRDVALDVASMVWGVGNQQIAGFLERESTKIWNWTSIDHTGQEVWTSFVEPEVGKLARTLDETGVWFDKITTSIGAGWDAGRGVNSAVEVSTQGGAKTAMSAAPRSDSSVGAGSADNFGASFVVSETPLSKNSPEYLAWLADRSRGGDGGAIPSPSLPSPVGGVYLGGAGKSIDGLGALRGIQLDKRGNLILLGESGADFNLPPLRLNDLVTVFRSVYINGEGPTVTINPNPDNPEKAEMVVIHSVATRDTYVGWILFQADRLMKGFSMGVDNLTLLPVQTKVPGFETTLDSIYFGSDDPRKMQKDGVWQRFWIVPASANRFQGKRAETTLFEVPLKVRTQTMKWANGKLVDDLTAETSPGAIAFSTWFTTNYDTLASEVFLAPPIGSGISKPVPIFAELRRIALMTAIAENLRDQRVPIPFWMRDYRVPPVRFESTTPGHEVTRKLEQGNTLREARIFGGVELSPDSKTVRTARSISDVAKAKPEDRAKAEHSLQLANWLENATTKEVGLVDQTPLAVHRIVEGANHFNTAFIPGADSQALGACRVSAADIIVPFGAGREIRLERHFNSFFSPQEMWGGGWTLDLPHLQTSRVPTRRDDGHVSYSVRYELTTPLNSLSAQFTEIRQFPELNNSKLQVPDQPGPFYGLADAHPKYLRDQETLELIRKDGTTWHFLHNGDLVAIEKGPQVTIFERGRNGEVTRIFALSGSKPTAEIVIEYGRDQKPTRAVGRSLVGPKTEPIQANYTYDAAGLLAEVSSPKGTLAYRYSDSRLESMTSTENPLTKKPKSVRSFTYNQAGQLIAEKRGDSIFNFATTRTGDGGLIATVESASNPKLRDSIRYDDQLRPVEAMGSDGTQLTWTYNSNGEIKQTITTADHAMVTVTKSADGRRQTVKRNGSPRYQTEFTVGGLLATFAEEDQVLLKQTWLTTGQISKITTGATSISFQYSDDAMLASVIAHPLNESGTFESWRKVTLDPRGFPTGITDFTGLDIQLSYDSAGRLASAIQKTPEGNQGYQVDRDRNGRINTIKSTWGESKFRYSDDGQLANIEKRIGSGTAIIDLTNGQIQRFKGFDGGETAFRYTKSGSNPALVTNITCANGLQLSFTYAADQQSATATVGDQRRVKLDTDRNGRIIRYSIEPVGH